MQQLKTQHPEIFSRPFIVALALLCLAYVAFEFFYTGYAKFCVDDFWFAHRIAEFKHALPYRDFAPYKTVLGYYILLPAISLSNGILAPLLHTKQWIVVINATVLFIACWWLRRYFPRTPILLTLLLLLCAQFTLEYSTNIRVDLLGYWCCLVSVLLLLENKNCLAGITLGLGFLVTQKVLWYVVASNAALGLQFLTVKRDRETLKHMLIFNLSLALTVVAYILLWSSISHLHIVLRSIFYEAYVMYQLDTYDNLRSVYWQYILFKNPLLFLLAPTTLLLLLVKPAQAKDRDRHVFLTVYAVTILLCLLPYKQVFPYYMIVTIPAFLLLYTVFFSWLLQIRNQGQPVILSIGREGLWAFIFLNVMGLLFLFAKFALAPMFLLVALIPVALGIYISGAPANLRGVCLPTIALVILSVGLINPLIQFSSDAAYENNRYQRSMLTLMAALLQNGGDYVAGIELLPDRNQPINGMRHLDARALEYLYHPTKKNSRSMLASLYNFPPVTTREILQALQQSTVKFYVNDYRMQALPADILRYLASQYQHYWGSIYLYAPAIDAGKQHFDLKFNGAYRLDSQTDVQLDGQLWRARTIMQLTSGAHVSQADSIYRLTLQADAAKQVADTLFYTDMAYKMI